MRAIVEFVDGVTKSFSGVREYTVNGGILLLHPIVADTPPTLIPWMHVRFITPWTVVDESKAQVGFKTAKVVEVDDGQEVRIEM